MYSSKTTATDVELKQYNHKLQISWYFISYNYDVFAGIQQYEM